MPHTQEWVIYFLTRMKSSHQFFLSTELTQCSDEITRLEAEILVQLDNIKNLEHKSRQESHDPASNLPQEINHIKVIASIHEICRKLKITKSSGNAEEHYTDKKNVLKTAIAHVDMLKESLVKKSLRKAYCEELITDMHISEAKSQFTITKTKADLAAADMIKALKNHDDSKISNEDEIQRRKMRLNALQENHSKQRTQSESKAENPKNRKVDDTAAKAIADARIGLEISKHSPDFAACTTYLARQTSLLLNLTLSVVKREVALKATMHDKSRARVFSKLALLRKQQWMDEDREASGMHSNDEKLRRKIALLNDEYEGMKCTSNSPILDDNLLDLLGWSKSVVAVVEAEEIVCIAWVQAAKKESSEAPMGLELRAAEKKLEKVVSEANAVFSLSAHLHSTTDRNLNLRHGIKENTAVKSVLAALLTACKKSNISSIVRNLASISLTVALDRLGKSSEFTLQLPESDSGAYLKLLDAKLYTPPCFPLREVRDHHDDTPSRRHEGVYADIVTESAFSELGDEPPAISHPGHQ